MRELERPPPIPPLSAATIAVVGRGNLGGAIARAAAGSLVVSQTGRSDGYGAAVGADAVLLCVPDTAIAETAQALTAAGVSPAFAGHTSGATGLEPLEPLAATGAEAFSLHPLQTVPDPGSEISGAPCAVSGASPSGADFAVELARALGMQPFELDDAQRAAYHGAASIASNFLVALEESAVELLDAAGIEDGRELIAPLVLRTAANWADRGPGALTGPIARGDATTVARHLAAIDELAPELRPLYEALAERARRIAAGAGSAR